MRRIIIVGIILFSHVVVYCQSIDLSGHFGRFWSPYKYVDYGTGLRKSSANYNFFPSISINRYYSDKVSVEASLFFTLYEQYYSTRKYISAFESTYGAGHLALRGCYSFVRDKKVECRIKGGVSLGIAPDMYEAEYVEMFVYPVVDSITRGVIKRDFTPVFPMLSTGLDISYKVANRFKLTLSANYQKGFIKISEYDIYYNDGSGSNDQRAKQWGTGDFYGIQLGLRYALRDEQGLRFGRKKINSK